MQIETGAQPTRRVLEGLLAQGASRFGSRVAASSAAGRLSFDKLRHDADEARRRLRRDSWAPPWAKGYHEGFSLEKWCDGIYARWDAGQLSHSQKRECAPLLHWLAAPRRKLAKVRREMARADRRDLAEIIDDWLSLWEPDTGDWEL